MIDLKNFRNMADDLMNDVQMTEQLKDKTLARLRSQRKSSVPLYKVLVPAACLVFVLGMVQFSGILPQKNIQSPEMISDAHILVASPESTGIAREQTRLLNTLDEAYAAFGKGFLVPAVLPEGFELKEITAFGSEKDRTNKMTLLYVSFDKTVLITEEMTDSLKDSNGYKAVTINGNIGYIKPASTNENEPAETEIFWYAQGVRYTLTGLVTKEEATQIAQSMK